MAVQLSDAVQAALLDAIEATIGVGPSMEIYSSAKPAAITDPDPSGKLVTLLMPSDWAANAAGNQKQINGPWTGGILVGGTAASFRIKSGGSVHIQGTVGLVGSGADLQLADIVLVQGNSLIFTTGAFTLTQPLPPIVNSPPSWGQIPTVSFVQGIAGQTFDITPYFTEGTAGSSTITAQRLPTGVDYDPNTKRLFYDGYSPAASANNVTLTADDGYATYGDLTTLVIREGSGTAGMAFKEGDVPTGFYVGSDLTGFQALVKNRWPDGSVKIAVVSWSGASATPSVPVAIKIRRVMGTESVGVAPTLQRLRSTVAPVGTISFGTYGDIDLATAIAGTPFRTWLSGPKCSEWHWRLPVGTDPTLVCWVYVRLYASDRVWIRVVAENGYLFVTPQDNKAYRATVTLKGTSRYDSSTTLTHYARTRWSMEFWYDGDQIQAPGHDGVYLRATKLFPNYSYTPANQTVYDGCGPYDYQHAWYDNEPCPTVPVTTVTPMGKANWRPDMAPGGYCYAIAIVPLWDVLYLIAPQGSANQEKMFRCSVANAVAAGTYGFYRDENTNLPVKFSDRPTLYTLGAASGGTPYHYEDAHAPSFSYATYLFTGDYLYIETMQQEATTNWRSTATDDREGADGLWWKWSIQPRQWAWNMRTLAQTICITPDGDGLLGGYVNSLTKNIDRQLAVYVDGTYPDPAYRRVNNLGVIGWPEWDSYIYYGPGNGGWPDGVSRGMAPWMFNFCGGVLGHIDDMRIISGGELSEVQRLMRFSLSHAVGLLGDNSGFPYTLGGAYGLPYVGTTRTFASSWADLWTLYRAAYNNTTLPDEKAGGGPAAGAPLVNTSPIMGGSDPGIVNGYVDQDSFSRSMWANMMPAICAAVDKNITGASAAWGRLTSASNWAANAAKFNNVPLWGVTPR